MNPEEWERLQNMFHAARELPEADVGPFLADACGGNHKLLAEVRQLMESTTNENDFLEEPVFELGLAAVEAEIPDKDTEPDLLIGKTLAGFRIEERIASGGMGEVYRAVEIRLGRQVALKFLSPQLVHDRWAKGQLRHEAKAVAGIEDECLCTIYGFFEEEEYCFIAMQYISGETIAGVIRSGVLSEEERVHVAIRIARAVLVVHTRRIIHRDVKPGNFMLTPQGQIKVLDFGIAKAMDDKPRIAGTDPSYLTREGLIKGTPGYMSPEQIRSEEIDHRSDIFSLGTLFFELFSGTHPFKRSTPFETASHIADPKRSLDDLIWTDVPLRLRPVIRKCLEYDRRKRYIAVGALLQELEDPSTIPRMRRYGRVPRAAIAVVLVFALVFTLLFAFWPRPVYAIAVIPFSNETRNEDYDYLADGLADSLAEKLAATKGFRIVPYTKVEGIRLNETDPESVAETVQADYVLTGRIFFAGEQLSVQTKLIERGKGTVNGSEHPVDPNQMVAAGESILDSLFSGPKLPVTSAAIAVDRRSGASAVFHEYRRGIFLLKKRDREKVREAIAHFERAIEIDPNYAPAHAALAECHVLLGLVAYGAANSKDAVMNARAAAREALDLDPTNASAHTSLGVILTYHEWNWAEAERELRFAIDAAPNHAPAHYWYSWLLSVTGRFEEAISEAAKAKELDPSSRQSDYNLARTYYLARQYDRSLQVLSGSAEKGEEKMRYLEGLNYLQKGRNDEALGILREVTNMNPKLGFAAMGYTLGKLGRRREALDVIRSFETLPEQPPQEIALIYIGLNENDKAFAYLGQALDDKYGPLSAISVEPLFDPIRADPRFESILNAMRLGGN